MHLSRLTFWLICAALLSGCLPAPALLTPFPSTTPSATPTATPTVIWFPPTATPTPSQRSTPSPTPDLLPRIGAVIWQDDFSQPDGWTLIEAATSNITINENQLTLALAQPKGYLYSVDESAIFGDFYAEITVNTNLCSGEDQYGMLVRYQSPANFYRFGLSCDGQVRLDRIFGGVASSPQPWMLSASVPSAAPATVRLGVWASGREMRFFVDGIHQFTVRDPTLPSGALGVFVRAAGETAVTVSFSDLIVRALTP